MPDTGSDLQALLGRVEKREKVARRRTVLFSFLPAIVGLALIVYAWGQIAAAHAQVVVLQARVASLQGEVKTLEKQIADLNQELQRSSTLGQFKCPYNLEAESKALMNTEGPRQTRVWEDIFTYMNRQPAWLAGGSSPDTGFNGPGFAAYILTKNKLVAGSAEEASGRLQTLLPREAAPRSGDVVFYEQGYAMFYFPPPSRGRPACVVGMTPVGVLALTYDWRPPLYFGTVSYQ